MQRLLPPLEMLAEWKASVTENVAAKHFPNKHVVVVIEFGDKPTIQYLNVEDVFMNQIEYVQGSVTLDSPEEAERLIAYAERVVEETELKVWNGKAWFERDLALNPDNPLCFMQE